jgi:hypothetical protein
MAQSRSFMVLERRRRFLSCQTLSTVLRICTNGNRRNPGHPDRRTCQQNASRQARKGTGEAQEAHWHRANNQRCCPYAHRAWAGSKWEASLMVPREIRGPRRFEGPPGLCAELDYLAPRFRTAVRAAANTYRRLGVRYALIGGLAAGAYGRPRSTKDADFLVGEEAFDSLGIVISFKPGIPQEACEVPIDNIPPHVDYADLYERALNEAVESDEPGVLIAGAEMVAVTKLVGG